MLISNGFTDDLFPADEAIRYYHRTRDTHPGTPLSLFFGNFGHQRAQNRPADADLLRSREDAWLDFYVKGVGSTPFQGVEAQTQVCPGTAPSGGPFSASNWAKLAPGRGALRERGRPDAVAGRRQPRRGQHVRPGQLGRATRAARHPAPTRPAWPPTGCPRSSRRSR